VKEEEEEEKDEEDEEEEEEEEVPLTSIIHLVRLRRSVTATIKAWP